MQYPNMNEQQPYTGYSYGNMNYPSMNHPSAGQQGYNSYQQPQPYVPTNTYQHNNNNLFEQDLMHHGAQQQQDYYIPQNNKL